jgi:hypothetical protein
MPVDYVLAVPLCGFYPTERLCRVFEPPFLSVPKTEEDCGVIVIKNNGTGMLQKVTEKVFQPFFTAKPTGKSTGLGLFLINDIVTKGHGGELKVETKEGEGRSLWCNCPCNHDYFITFVNGSQSYQWLSEHADHRPGCQRHCSSIPRRKDCFAGRNIG